MSKSATATVEASAILSFLTARAQSAEGRAVRTKEVENYLGVHTSTVKHKLHKLAAEGKIEKLEAGVYAAPKVAVEPLKVTKMQIVLAYVNAANDEGRAPKISEISEKTGVLYGTTNQMLDQARLAGTLMRFNKGWCAPAKTIGITLPVK